jgi:hypothetical protein
MIMVRMMTMVTTRGLMAKVMRLLKRVEISY